MKLFWLLVLLAFDSWAMQPDAAQLYEKRAAAVKAWCKLKKVDVETSPRLLLFDEFPTSSTFKVGVPGNSPREIEPYKVVVEGNARREEILREERVLAVGRLDEQGNFVDETDGRASRSASIDSESREKPTQVSKPKLRSRLSGLFSKSH